MISTFGAAIMVSLFNPSLWRIGGWRMVCENILNIWKTLANQRIELKKRYGMWFAYTSIACDIFQEVVITIFVCVVEWSIYASFEWSWSWLGAYLTWQGDNILRRTVDVATRRFTGGIISGIDVSNLY